MTLNTNLIKNMNKDQNLIFEAYTQTLTGGIKEPDYRESYWYWAYARDQSLTCFERLEHLWNGLDEIVDDIPELDGILLPILKDLEDAMMAIDKLDPNGATGTVPTQALFNSLSQIYPF